MTRLNTLKKRRKRRILFKRIRACLVLLIFILILNKVLSNFFVSKLTLSSLANHVADKKVDDRIKVVLDPGHGGHDIGANFEEINEKDIVLNISNKIGKILEENDINVIYTRTTDVALGDNEKKDLRNRVDISNKSQADYFISFHINDYVSEDYEEVYGFEIWTDYTNESSLTLGRNIETKLEELNYTEKRPMLDGSEKLHVIRRNNAPSVLVEFGFMNSYNDRSYFSNENNQTLLAEAIASSILESIE